MLVASVRKGVLPVASEMRRDFATREALVAYLREQFADAAARDSNVSPIRGGRSAAERVLARLRAGKVYQDTRNWLDGAVSRLSMYIRHGVLSLAEVRAAAVDSVDVVGEAEKFITELAWRDYWQRVYADIGEGIWDDREGYKTGFEPTQYADALPDDVLDGKTGLVCIDGFVRELYETGYLHNHARMWLAGYVVHWRRVRWQAGARWFLTHLLDGDPASNNLSWQWVASTFSSKPYFFNRENVERYTRGVYCRVCPLRGKCVFEGSYEVLERRLFPNVGQGR
jgi:deoxyribodipyrimidine photo-lyase